MAYALLSNRRLLKLAGDDTLAFLQGLITNDISKLGEGELMYAALLSPQGKFLHDFFIARWKEAYWLDVDASRLADLRQRLMMYRLRSKVTIDVADESLGVAAIWEQHIPAADELMLAADPRLAAMGQRLMGEVHAIGAFCAGHAIVHASLDVYEQWRIIHGIPDGVQDMIVDKSLLLEFGYEDLHGVDFKKGCYVGQEVTARSKFRAQLKKYLHQVSSGGDALPAPGTPIHAGDSVVGEMRSSSGPYGLALLRVEELHQAIAAGATLMAGDVAITAQRPSWMHIPDAA